MSKTILLIENDAPFATELSGALESMGYQTRVTGDGKEGLDLARELRPDAIVLCVELPRLSGYSICNKIKKDEAVKGIPLILTSSEATDEVFEDHKKLKVRAEEYLIKPYLPAVLLEKLSALVGMPEAGALPEPSTEVSHEVRAEEEVVSLEEELGLEPFAAEPGEELPALDLDSLPDEPAAVAQDGGGLDDDLRLLDEAFDGLSAPAASPFEPGLAVEPGPAQRTFAVTASDARVADEAIERALGVDRPVTSEDLEAASASLPEEDESLARAELDGVADEADLALGALTEAPEVAGPSEFAAIGTAAEAGDGAAAGSNLAELARLEAELVERRAALGAREADLRELKSRLGSAVRRAGEAESALGAREAEAASLKARGEMLAAQARKADEEAKAAREESRRAVEQARAAGARATAAEARISGAESRASSSETRSLAAEREAAGQRRAAEQATAALTAMVAELATAQAVSARLVEVEREGERLETELVVARGEIAGARSEVEKRTTELKRRVTELEAANSKNEERVVKAYLKIKGDEKVRDKSRKALAIALQLLDEGLPPDAPGEKRSPPPRPVPE